MSVEQTAHEKAIKTTHFSILGSAGLAIIKGAADFYKPFSQR